MEWVYFWTDRNSFLFKLCLCEEVKQVKNFDINNIRFWKKSWGDTSTYPALNAKCQSMFPPRFQTLALIFYSHSIRGPFSKFEHKNEKLKILRQLNIFNRAIPMCTVWAKSETITVIFVRNGTEYMRCVVCAWIYEKSLHQKDDAVRCVHQRSARFSTKAHIDTYKMQQKQ